MDAKFEIASLLCRQDFMSVLETIVESQSPARELAQDALSKRCNAHASNQIISFLKGGLPWK